MKNYLLVSLSLALLLSVVAFCQNASAKELTYRPIVKLSNTNFEDYQVQDWEKEFKLSKKEMKKFAWTKKDESGTFYIAKFKNSIDLVSIKKADVQKIKRVSVNKFIYMDTKKKVNLSQSQYLKLKGIKSTYVLTSGKIVVLSKYKY